MSLSPTATDRRAAHTGPRFAPGRFVKRFLPRGLFGRSLIIIVAPMVLLQGVVTYVFFERDLDTTTRADGARRRRRRRAAGDPGGFHAQPGARCAARLDRAGVALSHHLP